MVWINLFLFREKPPKHIRTHKQLLKTFSGKLMRYMTHQPDSVILNFNSTTRY